MEESDKEKLKDFEKEIKTDELTPLGWEVVKSDKLLKMKLPESEFVVNHLLPKGITILAGNPGIGKSWLLLEIAKAVGKDSPLFDYIDSDKAKIPFSVKGGRVLYIDEESPLSEIQRRWKMMGLEPAVLVDFMSHQGFRIDDKEKREALSDLIEWREYKLIIFDSLRDIHGLNENDSTEAQKLIDYLREFTKKGVAVLVSHHNRKESFMNPKEPTQVLRGSTALLAGIDSLLAIEGQKINSKTIELVISQSKLRQGSTLEPFKLNLIEQEGQMKFEYVGTVESEASKIEKAKEAIKDLLRGKEMFQGQIKEILIPQNISPRTVDRVLKEMKESNELDQRQGERKRIYLKLKG